MDLYFLAHGAVMALYCCILRVGEGLNKKKNAPLCDFICFSYEKRSPPVFLLVHLAVAGPGRTDLTALQRSPSFIFV